MQMNKENHKNNENRKEDDADADDEEEEPWCPPFSEEPDLLPGEAVPYVTTSLSMVKYVFENVCPITKDDVVLDLGCGDGRIVNYAAQTFGCKGVGVDISPTLIQKSKEQARQLGVSDITRFKVCDFFSDGFSIDEDVTVIMIYTMPKVMNRLEGLVKKYTRESGPSKHVRVVSFVFPFALWRPVFKDEKMGLFIYDASSQDTKKGEIYVDFGCSPAW